MNESPYLLHTDDLLRVFDATPTATAVHVGEDAVVQTANDAMLQIWGKSRDKVIGKSLEDALPELKGQPFIEMFKKVWNEGLTISGSDTAADLEIEGKIQTFYFNFEYRAIQNEAGKTICILHTAIDVTERVLKLEALENAREKEEALKREQSLNEELAAANEELNAINEELQEAQESLRILNAQLEERVLERVKDLSESEARFRNMAESTDILISIGNEESNATFFNNSWLDLTGRSMEDLLVTGWTDLIHPEDRARYLNHYHSSLDKKVPFTDEFRILNKIDEYRWLLATATPRFRVDGNFAGYISSAIDITDRKLYQENLQQINEELAASNEELAATNEELAQTHNHLVELIAQLSESELKLKQAIETGKMGTWSIDPNTLKVNMSEFVKDMLGLPLNKEVDIEQIMQAVDPNYHEMLFSALNNAITNQLPSDVEYPIKHLVTGKVKWVKATGRVFLDQKGNSTAYSGLFMDITERKLDELRKNDFIGMVSHELKTPLTAINGFVQVLQMKANKAEDTFAASALNKTYLQVKKMNTMINGFLNVSRLESGKLLIEKSTFLLNDLLTESIEENFVSQSSHEIVLQPFAGITVHADRDKIGNVISNLLSNAFKYSPNGSKVEIKTELVHDEIVVCIQDEGIGIRKEDVEKLFERYYRVESHHTISGFGIGLYLSAEIIHRHNGRIWVESEPDQGSAFYFSLPASDPDQ